MIGYGKMKSLNRFKLSEWSIGLLAGFAVSGFGGCSSNKLSELSPAEMLLASVNHDYSEELKHRKPNAQKVCEGTGVRLSQAIDKNIAVNPLTPEREKLLKTIAKLSSMKNRESAFLQCQKQFASAPECLIVKPSWFDRWMEAEEDGEVSLANPARKIEVTPTNRAARKKRARIASAVYEHIKKGDLTKVADQKEGDYYRALKHFNSWSPELQALSTKLLEQKECADPELYSYLALKSEEFFPNPELLQQAIKIYSKGDECAIANSALASNKYVNTTRFRLGLLEVMQNDCANAQKVFVRLSKSAMSEYATRAAYWSAYCAKGDANKELFLSSFDELFRGNPLGFHTLSINHGDSILVENLSKPSDPIIQLNSTNAQQNFWIRLLEDYDRLGNTNMVSRLMVPLKKNPDYLSNLDPGIRLYLATFAFRAKDTIAMFRILDSVFRTQSEYVMDSTLKLFYPIKHMETIFKYALKTNPFLVTALIRQESAFQEQVKSKVGAVGLMQLMPHTARLMDRRVSKRDLLKADVNLRLGIKYFEGLVDRYQGDVELALAAYNAGPEVVDQWAKRYPMKNKLLFLDLIPYSETRNYVTLIGRNYYWYTKLYEDQVKQERGVAQINPVRFQALK